MRLILYYSPVCDEISAMPTRREITPMYNCILQSVTTNTAFYFLVGLDPSLCDIGFQGAEVPHVAVRMWRPT